MSKKTELRELETVEVSLVDKGANKRTFAIKKSEKKEMDVIEAILAAPFEKGEAIIERLKKAELSEQAVEGIKSAVQILSAFQEEVPANLLKDLIALGGFSKQEEEEEEDKPEATEEAAPEGETPEAEEEEEAEKQEDEEEDEEEMQKRLASLPKNMRSMVEQLWKSNKSAITKAEELEAKIKKAEDEKRLSECVAIAKAEFGALPVKAEKLGSFIKSLDGMDDADFVLGLLRSSNEMISANGLTTEIGKSTSATNDKTSIAKAERMADALVEKEGITKAKALANVWKNNPSLYAEYQQEKGR
jgi:predicted regulator of Ras-like GTPase activity (Roadblock/LC7/MglB family)